MLTGIQWIARLGIVARIDRPLLLERRDRRCIKQTKEALYTHTHTHTHTYII
jgi:hypothetical protein